ncbi:sugar ABC transporter permease [Alkalihalobacillus alcalophilus ATCC 27647 = CGMCC 1.3604]|uniref:Sugar ABC transporter permease n=2 Tax=Alkalihalobacillus alcalophilus ATCC 27647 = CGMCC 1.3604 TaxID=1218173 RepID=A0A094YZQ4_ALKAL|nr:sugar ABC transporter permease [Alkalihalobacillus alcalophilus]KGA99047.1 sugar ABC transporter permease [Alkalihalobacillus alcalophilus ATCC 27647 = CGMCC 1.3604]MED1560691.1 sugar ABC transporter permease [Alkalihalobacillus alcalophilus]THG89808.1 sugar ABC transporter permease [Alkalihalobacillus alcalophilus ATCC 27647 = CGMCC 1.3604]
MLNTKTVSQNKLSLKLTPMKKQDYMWAYLFIAPCFLGLFIFNIGPIFYTIYLSFTEYGSFGQVSWIGLENYVRLFQDPNVWMALKNTFIFTAIAVPTSVFFSTVVAVLLNQKIRGVTMYRTLYFLPVITMPAAVGMVWKWLYNGDYGLINHVLGFFGIQGPYWLVDSSFALYAVIVVAIWSTIGYNMIIILAGLQNISPSYYEAAEIDGAGPFAKFAKITVPLLTPTLFFVSVISIISTLQTFELIYMMVGIDSPVAFDTQTLVYLFYREAFINHDLSYGATISINLFVIILVATIFQFYFQKKWVHYN